MVVVDVVVVKNHCVVRKDFDHWKFSHIGT